MNAYQNNMKQIRQNKSGNTKQIEQVRTTYNKGKQIKSIQTKHSKTNGTHRDAWEQVNASRNKSQEIERRGTKDIT